MTPCPDCGHEPRVELSAGPNAYVASCSNCYEAELVGGAWRNCHPLGYGATKEEAVADWLEQVEDAKDWREHGRDEYLAARGGIE